MDEQVNVHSSNSSCLLGKILSPPGENCLTYKDMEHFLVVQERKKNINPNHFYRTLKSTYKKKKKATPDFSENSEEKHRETIVHIWL